MCTLMLYGVSAPAPLRWLVGEDLLSADQKCSLEVARIIRADFLHQTASSTTISRYLLLRQFHRRSADILVKSLATLACYSHSFGYLTSKRIFCLLFVCSSRRSSKWTVNSPKLMMMVMLVLKMMDCLTFAPMFSLPMRGVTLCL